jgi:hypothetical protein
MNTSEDVCGLVEEYRALFEDIKGDSSDSLEDALTCQAGWSPQAADHLLQLAREYGSFILRNALAISLALDIEDGELGF